MFQAAEGLSRDKKDYVGCKFNMPEQAGVDDSTALNTMTATHAINVAARNVIPTQIDLSSTSVQLPMH